ncbi:SIR2 family protein [Methanosarcina sp.]|uniref:SIR2 family protein n=1 Tax=Methanosarcina sp. TaxID=2213 RepID=UPI003BB7A4D6
MITESISESVFIREFVHELHNRNVAVFAGAGLSKEAGYADWKGLLKDIINDLGLDLDEVHDLNLITIAQYHCNQAGGNRSQLTQLILDYFSQTKNPTENHEILAQLPIQTYWTTNYDKLIETALIEAKKVPDVKYTLRQLSVTWPDRDVVVYKMHGDVDHPYDAVILKDDYESYPLKMSPFISALRGDLIEKTFLFLGFSFKDPNIDYILSRVRALYENHQRRHYFIQRKISKSVNETEESFKHRELKQQYFIRDLKRFNIQTVLVNEYKDITELLKKIAKTYKLSSIFISGAAEEYGNSSPTDAQSFLYELSKQVAWNKNQNNNRKNNTNRIITGFGLGVGDAVINGVLAYLNDAGKTISEEDIVMRPFPQFAADRINFVDQKTKYRKSMIEQAGIAIFVYGNKFDSTNNIIVLSEGMKEEFELCKGAGILPIPVGATGYMAEKLWKEVWEDFNTYYPDTSPRFKSNFKKLQEKSLDASDLISIVLGLIQDIQQG